MFRINTIKSYYVKINPLLIPYIKENIYKTRHLLNSIKYWPVRDIICLNWMQLLNVNYCESTKYYSVMKYYCRKVTNADVLAILSRVIRIFPGEHVVLVVLQIIHVEVLHIILYIGYPVCGYHIIVGPYNVLYNNYIFISYTTTNHSGLLILSMCFFNIIMDCFPNI